MAESILAILATVRSLSSLAERMTAIGQAKGDLSDDDLARIRASAQVSDDAWDEAVERARRTGDG